MFEYEVSSLAFEFSGKDTTLLGHLTPRYGEHSRLNECPVSLDHYKARLIIDTDVRLHAEVVSRPRELPPQPLAEPYVTLSRHTAPVIQPCCPVTRQ
ncbi:hypothetical protein GCM10009086_01770 [Pseudomonas rhodesiae]